MDIELSKDADALICAIYKGYLEKRQQGIAKSKAAYLGSSESIHKNYMSKWMFEDVDETCRELHRSKLLYCAYADDVVWEATLSDIGVVYMEGRFGRNLKKVIDYLSPLIP